MANKKEQKTISLQEKKQNKYLVALREIEAQNNGFITPRMVVDSAKREDSPLHNYFDWDDSSAAEKFRIHQARMLMTTVKVEMLNGKEQDAYFNAVVTIEEIPMRGYVPMSKALTDEVIYKQVLGNALRELRYWENKYKTINDLKTVINKDSLNQIEKKIKK